MDYLFENLNDETFQEFCQALLVGEFPTMQCIPVGQRDGGRDAVAYHSPGHAKEKIVFQAKFVRKPLAERNAHKWLVDTMKGELPKIRGLIEKGAEAYYLLTNVPGTAYPEHGSIDKMNPILCDSLGIPAQCFWREDLARRLEANWDLKWSFPQILPGQDILSFALQAGMFPNRERQARAIRTFLRTQYEMENQVRFRQIHLQQDLLDLFVDVPVTVQRRPSDRRLHSLGHLFHDLGMKELGGSAHRDSPSFTVQDEDIDDPYSYEHQVSVGAATLLLDSPAQHRIPAVVLEAAPGQGKSTICQYVCQVHRMKLLGESESLARVPSWHVPTDVRLPFKIDLRDLATWVSKQNPFIAEDTVHIPPDWQPTLEAFMSAQIRHHSGGVEFTVDDLHSTFKCSAVLIALDGLDEVAEAGQREKVVTEVVSGTTRLREIAQSLQVIVTTRPSAFSNSPAVPKRQFTYLTLSNLPRRTILEYAENWLGARRASSQERAEVNRVLRDKLSQAHLRDLTRNPMQLTILLSLIYSHGSSLPDKRTALYDAYMNLFFNRESEKSEIVRQHRDLLISIHGYLGWVLHAEAEEGASNGRITEERLKQAVKEYVEREGFDTEIITGLFLGVVERVVALVSRIQGTFEFEVQPLREYFAARHLYETAQYSPVGVERRGTLPDRFDALARNFYWLNVVRFYAGCYNKGELPSLISRLNALASDDNYRRTNHPKLLTVMLLQDWVFSQDPWLMREAVSLILDDSGLPHAIGVRRGRHLSPGSFVLPRSSGNRELVDRCLSLLDSHPMSDRLFEITELLRTNSTPSHLAELWKKKALSVAGKQRTQWIAYGLYLGVLSELAEDDVEAILSDNVTDVDRMSAILRSKHAALLNKDQIRSDAVVDAILSGSITLHARQRRTTVFAHLAQSVNVASYLEAFEHPQQIPLSEVGRRWSGRSDYHSSGSTEQDEFLGEGGAEFTESLRIIDEARRLPARTWLTELSPWETLVEELRRRWGDKWVVYELATLASAIRSHTETGRGYSELLDHSVSLCQRTRYARLRAGAPEWWSRQLANPNSGIESSFVSLVFFAWASTKTALSNIHLADELFSRVSSELATKVIHAIRQIAPLQKEKLLLEASELPPKLSERTVMALLARSGSRSMQSMYFRYLEGYQGSDPLILSFCCKMALRSARSIGGGWDKFLELSSRAYAAGGDVFMVFPPLLMASGKSSELPLAVAEKVADHPHLYPQQLAIVAEERCRRALTGKVIPVARTAEQDGWFIRQTG